MKRLLLSIMAAVGLLTAQTPAIAADGDGVRHVNPVEAQNLIEQEPEIIILDVRTAEEFAAGHLKGAVNIDYYGEDFAKRVAGLDPNAAYLVHCKSGNRSTRALPFLESAGLKNVIHLDGGFDGWRALGLQIVSE